MNEARETSLFYYPESMQITVWSGLTYDEKKEKQDLADKYFDPTNILAIFRVKLK